MGGDPAHGDVPNPKGQDEEEKASRVIDEYIRSSAIENGANMRGSVIIIGE
jgi:hypothetical protein